MSLPNAQKIAEAIGLNWGEAWLTDYDQLIVVTVGARYTDSSLEYPDFVMRWIVRPTRGNLPGFPLDEWNDRSIGDFIAVARETIDPEAIRQAMSRAAKPSRITIPLL